MTRIRLTQRRSRLLAARAAAASRVADKIAPILASQFKRIKRRLGNSNVPLKKRIGKIKVPSNFMDALTDCPQGWATAQYVALYKTQTFLKQYPAAPVSQDQQQWDAFKKTLIAALILALLQGVTDMGDIENEVMLSRGYNSLTFDPQTVIDDYQRRIGRNLDGIVDTTESQVTQTISNWYMSNEPYGVLLDRLDYWFSEQRAAQIADTETGNALSQIIFQEMLSHGFKEWYWDALGENPCESPIVMLGVSYDGCRDLNGRVFKLGDPMPPDAAHPNCKCLPTPKEL